MGNSRPSFLYFRLINTIDNEYMNKISPMAGFEPRTSVVGSDRSTNWATTNLIIESKRFISPDSFAGAEPLVAADLEVVKEHRSRMIRAVSRHGIADHVRWTWKRDILLNLILNDSLLFPGHS